jgi:hypothetical protein
MTKYLVGLLCLVVLLVTVAMMGWTESEFWFLASNHNIYMIGRLLMAVAVLSYLLLPRIRIKLFKNGMLVSGIVLLYLGVAGLVPNGSIGINNYFPLPLDVFLALEGGIACLLLAAELPANTKFSLPHWLYASVYKIKLEPSKPKTTQKHAKTAH